jgi:hypothetical protein
VTYPIGRALTEDEASAWMRDWLRARAVGWEAYGLAQAVVAIHDESDVMRQTLFLEAALAHARCLIEFLIGREHPKTGKRRWKADLDVTPSMMLSTWAPETELVALWPILTKSLDRIDKALAHVSQSRVAITRTAWEMAPLMEAVLIGLATFITLLRSGGHEFRARCLEAWVEISKEHMKDRGVSLETPIDVVPASSLLFVVPIGESEGRAAALMQRADQMSP